MKKVISMVPASRFEKYQTAFPSDWTVEYRDVNNAAELISDLQDVEYLLVKSTDAVPKTVFRSCRKLRIVQAEGVGYNQIDIDSAREAGVYVCNNRAVNNTAVAEHTVGLILSAMRRTALCDYQIKHIGYEYCQRQHREEGEKELYGKRIGLVGIGAIGKEVVRRLSGWNCDIQYYDVFRLDPQTETELGVVYVSFEELIQTSDILSVHVPVLPSTVDMISGKELEHMKSGAYLINTSRGEIVNQQALALALEQNRIAGAAIDTLYPEPAPADHPLLNLSDRAAAKLTLTPHIGGTTDEAFVRMLKNAIANFRSVEEGKSPANIVNGL